jgi:hypothetical protein
MHAAGWIHPTPVVVPLSRTQRGSLVELINLTGLVSGETSLGAELALLYTPAAIARSALASLSHFVWDGTNFIVPS